MVDWRQIARGTQSQLTDEALDRIASRLEAMAPAVERMRRSLKPEDEPDPAFAPSSLEDEEVRD